MIKTKDLQYTYPSQEPLVFPDISCSKNQQLLISGPSGSGKTTFLHLLAGLRMPGAGEVIIQEKSLFTLNTSQRDQFRGRHIGLIFQKMHFVASLNVLENLLLQQYLAGVPQDKNRAENLLDRLGLLHRKHQNINKMSLGEQQRVSIARALINRPAVVLADEPTSSLDDLNCKKVMQLLEEMAANEQAALVVVTHDQRVKDLISYQIAL